MNRCVLEFTVASGSPLNCQCFTYSIISDIEYLRIGLCSISVVEQYIPSNVDLNMKSRRIRGVIPRYHPLAICLISIFLFHICTICFLASKNILAKEAHISEHVKTRQLFLLKIPMSILRVCINFPCKAVMHSYKGNCSCKPS